MSLGLEKYQGQRGQETGKGSSLSDKVNVNPDKAKQGIILDRYLKKSIVYREAYFKAEFKPPPESRKITG